MADFLDSEAEESEQEDEDIEPHERKKLKKLKAASDSEEEEEDDEDRLREELKDLIDDAPIEDESDAESDGSGGSRKRKKSDDEDELSDRLEDDDYDLIEENLGVKIDKNKHRFKRLRRIQDEESDQEPEDETLRREVIAENLFATGSDDEEERRSDRGRSQQHQTPHERAAEDAENFDDELSDESDADDFIVDDDGVPITEKRKKRRPIFQDANLQEGQDIFGVDFDYEEFEKYDEEDDYESEDDDYEEEDGVEKAPGEKEKRPKKVKKKVMKKSIFDIYEPSELKRGHFTDLDNEIRKTDIPERMQLREVPVTPVAEGSNELEEEAEWIYKQAFCKSSVSDQDPPGTPKIAATATPAATTANNDWDKAAQKTTAPSNNAVDEDDWDTPGPAAPAAVSKPSVDADNWDAVDEDNWDEDAPKKTSEKPAASKTAEPAQPLQPGRKPSSAIGKIKQALDFMRNQQLEVPFIAFYRKEYVQPELNINDLWKVYKYDARWCQLLTRKKSLLALFEKMRSYQTEKIMKDIDAPIPDEVRVVRDEDFDRLKNVQTPEELKDVHNHFLLYYAHEIPAMQEAYKKRERQRIRDEKRAARKLQLLENAGGLDEDGNEITPPVEEEVEIVEEEEAEDQQEENLKYTRDSGPYAMCRKAGICGIAKKFGLKPEQFAENLRDNYQRHEVEQEPIEPIELAKQYVSAKFSTPEEVLEAAKFMVARQLAREPLLRKSVREIFYERAKIVVQPTKRGTKEIDENHACYGMKYIKMKPVRELAGDQFLKLIIAEQDKLLTITIIEKFEGNTSSNYLEETKQLYQKDEFSKSVQDWNKLRAECVEVALTKMVLPDLRKELHSILLAEAKDAVMKACCRKLYNWIKVAPYSVTFPEEDEYEWETSRGGACRIMGVGYVPDYTQSAFCAIVNVDGEVTDYLRLPHLMKRKNSNRADEKLLKESDLLAIQNFIRAKKPHVVVIGGESRESTMIQQDISECIKLLRDEEQFPDIQVEIADNELAKIYSNSNKGEADFREYPTVLRQAVSVARRLQDPLVEYSQLCTADEEILCLRYHTLQDQLNKEELLENLYLEFINRTNEVGVDVNLAVQNPLTVNLVQFICGLGPRKGAALIKILKQTNQRIENRTQLVTACHMGPKVFINCSGFIKIDTNSLGDSTEAYVEVLDGSRVHPETYEWARKMAVDALEYEDEEDANPAGALEEILESPERLKDLDLDAFAVELERQGFGNKSITLYDIRAELNSRYKDLRTPYRSPNAEELFDMLTKETPESFYVGRMVLASVVGISHRKPQGEQLDQANPVRNDESGLWQCPFCMVNDFPELSEVWNHFDAGACPGQATGVKLRLDNGLNGFIHIKNLSDKHVKNPEERVQMGQTIHVRIIKIDVDRFSIDCTSKSSDLADKNNEWRPTKDTYYDQDAEDAEQRKEEDSKKVKARQQYIKRVIVHPSFHNISYTEAIKIMDKMDQGEVIVRPSSKGSDHLTATWKIKDDVFQHIDVREEGKENAFSLGQSLWIGNEEFEDLDEIIARHINPMAALARDLFNYKYYRDTNGGDRVKAEELLKEEKKKNANKIHYIVSVAKNYPGKFLISYLPRNKYKHEYVTVTPDGFRFRSQMFDSVNTLLKWFKEHFKDPIPQTTPANSTPRGGGMTSLSSRTPYTTPGSGLVHNDAIQRVAQNMPSHMLHSLSQVASQTPHYPHTPGYGGQSAYINTPYTPSGQTPYMTPYHTPHTSQTPRYGQTTPSGHVQNGTFLHPGAPPATTHHRSNNHSYGSGGGGSSSSSHHHQGASPHSRSGTYTATQESMDWQKASDSWGAPRGGSNNRSSREGSRTPRDQGRTTPKSASGRTPRYEDEMARKTPQYDNRPSSRASNRSGYYGKSPRSQANTPGTNASPTSMTMGGDSTPLWDEN